LKAFPFPLEYEARITICRKVSYSDVDSLLTIETSESSLSALSNVRRIGLRRKSTASSSDSIGRHLQIERFQPEERFNALCPCGLGQQGPRVLCPLSPMTDISFKMVPHRICRRRVDKARQSCNTTGKIIRIQRNANSRVLYMSSAVDDNALTVAPNPGTHRTSEVSSLT
jgi:hypothetical protein